MTGRWPPSTIHLEGEDIEVSFRTTKLRKAYQEGGRAYRAWGKDVGRKYVQRVEVLHAMPTFEGVKQIRAYRPHPLKGQRGGEWALDLAGNMRIIVIPSEDGKSVEVKEVSKHYD